MKSIYLDNGATSFPKAPGVGEAMKNFIDHVGVNVSRGAYGDAFQAQRVILDCRQRLLRLADAPPHSEVVFTANITQSLNFVLKGLLKPGDHVITGALEHNAVMRPLHALQAHGVSYSMIPATTDGILRLDQAEALITPATRAIVITHASNVCGTITDLETIHAIASQHQLPVILDAAQTFGAFPFSMAQLGIDILCFTGHKALLGPQGIGGFILNKRMSDQLSTIMEGGTGSLSDTLVHPDFLPDKFEIGTPNVPGIFGLRAALQYLNDANPAALFHQEQQLLQYFLQGLMQIPGIRIVGPTTVENRTAVVSVDFSPKDNAEIAHRLDREYHIQVRVGMHCAPLAHQALGTFPQGTVRFSLSHFTTCEELDLALDAVTRLAGEA